MTRIRELWPILLLAFLAAENVAAPAVTPVIRLHGDKEPVIEVSGLSAETLKALAKLEPSAEQWQDLLAVYVERGDRGTTQTAMLGSYRVEKDSLRFEPRFPLVRGVSYRVIFQPARLPGRGGSSEAVVEKVLLLPKAKPARQTVISHVYPSKDELPENQLKFYLHFSAPMSHGDVYEHIHLIGPDGKEDKRAFLDLPQELWDHDGKRLTLFLDPGRVKRGLKPREDLGPVLEAGKRYTLVIDRDWNDADGNTLKESYRKTFRVQPLDERQPDPKTWKIQAPKAETILPVVIVSPESLDHALMQRLLWIINEQGEKIAGKIEVTVQETNWRFTPAKPWKAGKYHLVADTRLEDLAGNSIARPFEIDEVKPGQRVSEPKTVQLPFVVR